MAPPLPFLTRKQQQQESQSQQPPSSSTNEAVTPHVPVELASATRAIHADDHLSETADVAPPMHVSTNFHYDGVGEELVPFSERDANTFDKHSYSRFTAPNSTRLEVVLSSLLKGRALTYSSGLAAYHAALVYLNPKRISIGDCYHGCHGVVGLHSKVSGLVKLPLDCPPEALEAGDIIHVETPINPTGEVVSIAHYARKAHSRGAYLFVDATFGPPSLQNPFQWGADIVMHSGTKFLGGHSDMLCGVLAVQKEEWFWELRHEREFLGSMMGSFEGWLGVRSLRTLELRVQRQSRNAELLVGWLYEKLQSPGNSDEKEEDDEEKVIKEVLAEVKHGSIQFLQKQSDHAASPQQGKEEQQPLSSTSDGPSEGITQTDGSAKEENPSQNKNQEHLKNDEDKEWIKEQMPSGHSPVFALFLRESTKARALPGHLKLFHHATSLGGVESLIEWRRMSDKRCDERLVRVSVGVENWEDLKEDLLQGLRKLASS